MCSNISTETTRSKRRSSTSSFTSAVTTSTLAGARASIHSRCKREFETAVIRAAGNRSAAKSANDPQPQPRSRIVWPSSIRARSHVRASIASSASASVSTSSGQ